MKRQMGRRGLIWLLVLALAALLCACGQTAGSDAAPAAPPPRRRRRHRCRRSRRRLSPRSNRMRVRGPGPGPEGLLLADPGQQPQADGLLVTASIYTLLLPEDWQDHCVAEETGQWLSLYSKGKSGRRIRRPAVQHRLDGRPGELCRDPRLPAAGPGDDRRCHLRCRSRCDRRSPGPGLRPAAGAVPLCSRNCHRSSSRCSLATAQSIRLRL